MIILADVTFDNKSFPQLKLYMYSLKCQNFRYKQMLSKKIGIVILAKFCIYELKILNQVPMQAIVLSNVSMTHEKTKEDDNFRNFAMEMAKDIPENN